MRRGILVGLLAFIVMAPSALVFAQGDASGPTVGGDVRLRTEYKRPYDYFTADGGEPTGDDATFMRTRMSLSWELANNIGVMFQIQDSRTWGVDSVGDNADADVDVRQAYVTLNNLQEMDSLSFLGTNDVDVHVGRINLPTIGDGYIVAANGWGNTGPLSWDGMWIDSSFGSEDLMFDVDFLWADLQNNNPPTAPAGPAEGSVFWFLQGGTDDVDFVGGDVYLAAYKGDFGALTDLDMQIFGVRLYSNLPEDTLDGLDVVFEYAMQSGDLGVLDIDSNFMLIRGTYALAVEDLNPVFGIGYSVASGDGNSADNDVETWISPLDWNHAHLGHYDLVDNSNIADLFLTSQVTVGAFDLHLDVHFLSLDEESDGWYTVGSTTGNTGATTTDDELGTEFDFYSTWDCGESLNFQAGVSLFQAGDAVKEITGGFDDDGTFFYLQMTVPFGQTK